MLIPEIIFCDPELLIGTVSCDPYGRASPLALHLSKKFVGIDATPFMQGCSQTSPAVTHFYMRNY